MTLHSIDNAPVIVGAGLAGLATALSLAPLPCTVLSAAPFGEGAATAWAQGGIAAALAHDDSPAQHAADTDAAGDGLCDPATVARITAAGPDAIARLAAWGARFDTAPDGTVALGLEAAHSHARIVHATGDATGREILRALLARARATSSIRLLERAKARALLLDREGRIAGLLIETPNGLETLAAARVVLATGGLGALYAHTTNPLSATGTGLALAARAGATLADLEFVQFHPTAIDVGQDPMPLASEAIRGEGATLIDDTGRRFMPARDPRAGFAPRDIVARAVAAELDSGRRVFLDATNLGERFATRFPSIARLCRAAGLDPATAPIPIRPAAHYAMGGVATDSAGRTDVEGLWAVGECAATGLHGANRLASNSLLEAVVTAATAAADLAVTPATRRRPDRTPPIPANTGPAAPIRPLMTEGFGVTRDAPRMERAARALLALEGRADPDALTAAFLLAASALARTESRGAHHRLDHGAHAPAAERSRITLAEARARLAPFAPPARRSA